MKLIPIHTDKRGSITVIDQLLKNKEFTILEIKKGFARGGCYHDEIEHFMVIKGNVQVGTFDVNAEWKGYLYKVMDMCEGRAGTFLPNVAHYFLAIEDSIIIEFGVSAENKLENKKFQPMFDIVNKLNIDNGGKD